MGCSCPECGSTTIGTLNYCAMCEHNGCSSRRAKCVDDAPEIRTDGGEPAGESGSESYWTDEEREFLETDVDHLRTDGGAEKGSGTHHYSTDDWIILAVSIGFSFGLATGVGIGVFL